MPHAAMLTQKRGKDVQQETRACIQKGSDVWSMVVHRVQTLNCFKSWAVWAVLCSTVQPIVMDIHYATSGRWANQSYHVRFSVALVWSTWDLAGAEWAGGVVRVVVGGGCLGCCAGPALGSGLLMLAVYTCRIHAEHMRSRDLKMSCAAGCDRCSLQLFLWVALHPCFSLSTPYISN